MGSVKSERKAAASRRNGSSMKAIIQAGKVALGVSSNGRTADFDSVGIGSIPVATAKSVGFIAPKGSYSKDDLKALIAGGAKRSPNTDKCPHGVEIKYNCPECQDYEIWGNTPHAPFDFNDEEGNPHRVRAYGKQLKICFLRDGVEEPMRNLVEGELEALWEKRIK